jgi:hypothetical protein
VRIDVEGNEFTVPFAEIDTARLHVEIDFNREALDGI